MLLRIKMAGLPTDPSCSKPLHIQRLEQAVDVNILRECRNDVYNPSEDDDETFGYVSTDWDELLRDCDDTDNPLLNVEACDMERSWLTDILQSEPTYETTAVADDIEMLLKVHNQHKKVASRASPNVLEQHMYYGTGLLSNFDKYPEHKKIVQTKMGVKRIKKEESPAVKNQYPANTYEAQEDLEIDLENGVEAQNVLEDEMSMKIVHTPKGHSSNNRKAKTKKFKDEESKRKWEEMMTVKRRKYYINMVKKEVGKQQRAKVNRHKEALLQTKKIALACQKVQRNKALQSARAVKELQ